MDGLFLVVAADGKVREALAAELRRNGCTVTLAENAEQAERVVQDVYVETVLVESHLPDATAEQLRERLETLRPDCRVVGLTSFSLVRNSTEVFRFGLSDYLLPATQILELLRPEGARAPEPGTWQQPATQALVGVIDVLVGLLELEDKGFGSSSHVAMELARDTAEELDASEGLMYEVVLGTLLRDVGRAGLHVDRAEGGAPEDPVREHVNSSLRMLEHVDFPWKVLPVVRHHHEHYNGSGAPDGLRGREIPMGARIVAVVDAYVALTTGKTAKAVSSDEALDAITRRTGHEFDPEVVEAFHRVMDKRLAGRRTHSEVSVVLIDRDPQFRRALKVRLGNLGLKVREAAGFERCAERLLKEPPDLVLVAIDPDPKEAFQLLHELQQDGTLCRIPVAFLSARADRTLKLRALRQGVDDFLTKKTSMEELVARIENIVVRGAIRADGDARRGRRGVTGNLENLSLPDIVQTLAIGMKTASVTLTSGDRQGRMWYDHGSPRHAETGELKGEEAFYEMLRWESGEFVIEHGATSGEATIERDAMYLLMEGLRLMDEGQRSPLTIS